MKIGVLGGGLSGLSLGMFLGDRAEVLERDGVCGGLCRTVRRGPCSYDLGGHILFSRDGALLEFIAGLLGENVARYRRNNRIWFKGRLVKYPFENGLSALPKPDIYECLLGFLTRSYPEPRNVRDWCYWRFGKGIAERYLIPYNEKIWKTDPSELGLDWVAGRVPEPPLEDIVKSALGIETEGYTHQLHFLYPKSGGIEALPRALEARVPRVEKGFTVREVRSRRGGGWVVSDGSREREYDRIVSTIPLPDLVAALGEEAGAEARAAAARLRWNSLLCVMVRARARERSDRFAVYFPQPDLPFHRVCFYDYFGESCAPPGTTLAVAEITVPSGDVRYGTGDEELSARVVDGLAREGFIDPAAVEDTHVSRREYAYVVNDLAYAAASDSLRRRAAELQIALCGRFAEWRYLNMDDCVHSARETARALGVAP